MTRSLTASLALLLVPCWLVTTLERASAGECCNCPTYVFCRPKPPKIKYQCVCPKPLCPGCQFEHFGYYPTCWRSWPYPPDYSYCPVPPTIATAPCGPTGAPNSGPQLEQLPTPSKMPEKPAS
jgi:hypothetical protein